jgi:sterol desaturase/sphingolipid hydroxylase (fatty acid hydroxylase superfamily)
LKSSGSKHIIYALALPKYLGSSPLNLFIDRPELFLISLAAALFFSAMAIEMTASILLKRASYEYKDTLTNLTLYIGSLGIDFFWLPAVFAIFTLANHHSLFKFGYQWWLFQGHTPAWHWLLLLVADDFAYYWFHRTSHGVWILWASHENHHSSNYFNLSVAARQTLTPFLAFIFWLPLAFIGFDPLMILTMQFISLAWQSYLHTELLGDFGALGSLLNSPSHHRVHHGTESKYLDKNFGGIFIVWDKVFGTFKREEETPTYGIGEKFQGYMPWRAISHEYVKLLRAIKKTAGIDKFKIAFMPPGWSSDDL